jgi:hypothetical protein
MITRDKFYQHFGPKQMETVMRFMVKELNVLRARASMDPLNKDDVLNELNEIWDSLPDYDWMNKEDED